MIILTYQTDKVFKKRIVNTVKEKEKKFFHEDFV